MDELLLRVECDAETHAGARPRSLGCGGRSNASCKRSSACRTMVEIVGPNTIARTDFKARRVIDDRKVFADMQAQIERGRN